MNLSRVTTPVQIPWLTAGSCNSWASCLNSKETPTPEKTSLECKTRSSTLWSSNFSLKLITTQLSRTNMNCRNTSLQRISNRVSLVYLFKIGELIYTYQETFVCMLFQMMLCLTNAVQVGFPVTILLGCACLVQFGFKHGTCPTYTKHVIQMTKV